MLMKMINVISGNVIIQTPKQNYRLSRVLPKHFIQFKKMDSVREQNNKLLQVTGQANYVFSRKISLTLYNSYNRALIF